MTLYWVKAEKNNEVLADLGAVILVIVGRIQISVLAVLFKINITIPVDNSSKSYKTRDACTLGVYVYIYNF